MKKRLEPWTRKVIQGGVQINQLLVENNLTWDDVDKWLKENPQLSIAEQTRPKEQKNVKKPNFKKCPNCNQEILRPIAGNEQGGEGIWQCRKCRYSEYDGRSIEEMIKDITSGGN